MSGSHFFNKEDFITILNDVVEKTLGEVDKKCVFDKTIGNPKITGIAGAVIEQSVLGYPPDQAQRPDLNIDGTLTELKTTGMRQKKVGNKLIFEAKEPTSITAVSINTIAAENFYDSNFWHKVANLLFVFYLYESSKTVNASEYANFHIKGYRFHNFSEEDIAILKRDWQVVHDFIANIQEKYSEEEAKKEYPKLSTIVNKQITYLDTAPKYPNPPRFRLRKRVVDVIIQQTFNGDKFEKLPNRYLGNSDVEKKCAELTRLFFGWSMADILEHFGVAVNRSDKTELKQYAEQVIIRMFGGTSKKISKIEMFRKLGYIGKSITISANETRTEDIKLMAVDFDELEEVFTEDDDGTLRLKVFEDSDLYHYFHDNKLLCIIFQENEPNVDGKVRLDDNKFIGFKIIDLSDEELMSAALKTWEDTRNLIHNKQLRLVPTLDKNGNQRYTPKTNIPMCAPNFPKSKDYIVFFRGTGADATDKIYINGIEMLRQSYWIKGSYLVDKLKNIPYIGETIQ